MLVAGKPTMRSISTFFRLAWRGLAVTILAATIAQFAFFVFVYTPPLLRSFARGNESLPATVIESGHTVYCRMRVCDFRFPLPPDCVVEHVGTVQGGFDTIDGSVRISATDRASLDMRAYAELLQRHGFRAEAPGTTWLFASSTNPLGGSIEASLDTPTTATIRYGYFGDY